MDRIGLAAQERDSADADGLVRSLLESAAIHLRGGDRPGALALLRRARAHGATDSDVSGFEELAALGPAGAKRR